MNRLLLLLFFIYPLIEGISQSSEIPEITNKFLLKNAQVIVKPGQAQTLSSILIEDGFITKVGSNIVAPFDAQVIDADSMYIYPGFIASLSHIGVPKKETPKDLPKIKDPGTPPNDRAGITPEQSLRDVLNSKDKSIAAFRKQGITVSHSVPMGKMLPGKGSIILLNGSSADDMLIEEDVSLFAQLSTASRMYPGTVMGVMAKFRDLFRKSNVAVNHEKVYKSNNKGVKRPSYDKSIKALYPAVNKEIPVFFSVPKTRDIQRAFRLQKELGFNIVPSEIKQGWLNIDKLKTQTVLLSLDLPKEEKEDKKKKKKEESEEAKKFKVKKKEAYDAYVGQSKLFNEKNVNFSYSLLNTKAADIQKNLSRLVENGLSEDVALAAMTTNPAKALGIDDITGSIEQNKLANLIVTTKPYFDKMSKIKYVFVEGNKYEYDTTAKKKTSSDSTSIADLSGSYTYNVEIPGDSSGKVNITNTDGKYSLEIISDENPSNPSIISKVKHDGNNLKFKFTTEAQGTTVNLNMNLDFEGDAFKGKVSVEDYGSFPITGKKITPKH